MRQVYLFTDDEVVAIKQGLRLLRNAVIDRTKTMNKHPISMIGTCVVDIFKDIDNAMKQLKG